MYLHLCIATFVYIYIGVYLHLRIFTFVDLHLCIPTSLHLYILLVLEIYLVGDIKGTRVWKEGWGESLYIFEIYISNPFSMQISAHSDNFEFWLIFFFTPLKVRGRDTWVGSMTSSKVVPLFS